MLVNLKILNLKREIPNSLLYCYCIVDHASMKNVRYVDYVHRCDKQEAVVLIEKCASSLSQVFSLSHVYTSKMQTSE